MIQNESILYYLLSQVYNMENRDKIISLLIALLVAASGYFFDLKYIKIASSGLTLSSIVLAVYIAAIIGLINSNLARQMRTTEDSQHSDRTQLGTLTTYFKIATSFSIGTIIISSLLLLFPAPLPTELLYNKILSFFSILGLVFYAENLFFLIITIRFILNRQIWDS